MGAIVIVIIIVAAFVLGHFYIRNQRKAMLAERALKLKVAEGGREQKPAKKKRKRKKRWFNSSNKHELPGFLVQDIYNDVPVMTEALLQARHAVNDGYSACSQASAQRASAAGRLDAVTLPPRGSINIERWLQHVLSIALDAQKALRAEREAQVAYTVAIVKHGDASGDLSGFLHGLDKFDLEELDDDAVRILEIARTAVNECKYLHERPELVDVKPQPEIANAEFDVLLAQLFERGGTLATAGIELVRVLAGVREAVQNSDALAKDPELPELEKPNDGEVAGWMTTAMDWATCRQHAEQAVIQVLPTLTDVIASTTAAQSQVRDLLSLIDGLENRLIEEAKAKREAELRSTAWSWRRSFDDKEEAGEKKPLFGKESAAAAEQSEEQQSQPEASLPRRRRRQTAAVPFNWGDDAAFNFRRGRRQKEDWAPKKEWPALLSDEQLCRKRAIQQVVAVVEAALLPAQASLESFSKRTVTRLSEECTEDEKRLDAQLRATMRKLGFAVAQHASAKSKLTAACEESSPGNQAVAANLDEANVDAYIRAHRSWVDGASKAQAAAQQREERIAQLSQQVAEREQQLGECLSALAEMIPSQPAGQADDALGAALAVTLASARLLVRAHKASPPATTAQAPSSRSSAEDRKKKNKRRRR